MMKITLLCLVATLFISPVFADVHKWKDADGKMHYGDAPPLAGTAKVKTDKQTEDEIANGERIRAEMGDLTRQDAMKEVCEKRRKEIDESTYQPTSLAGALIKQKEKQNYERDCVFRSSSDSGVIRSKKQKPTDAFFTGRMEQMPTGEWNCQYNYNGQNVWKIYRGLCPSNATGAND